MIEDIEEPTSKLQLPSFTQLGYSEVPVEASVKVCKGIRVQNVSPGVSVPERGGRSEARDVEPYVEGWVFKGAITGSIRAPTSSVVCGAVCGDSEWITAL